MPSHASRFIVRKAAVLGAGVMGAQIAAHLVNANVPALLFELPAKEGDPNGNVLKAIENLQQARAEPARDRVASAAQIQPANYDQHLDLLKECDLVIEAISERMDWKADLYRKGRAASRRAHDLRQQYVGALDQPAGRRRFRRSCATASAACISSIRRATCIWSS